MHYKYKATPMNYLYISLFLSFFINSACSQNTNSSPKPIESSKNLQTIIKEKKISKRELLIKIDKSAYTLSVYHKDSILISYPCVFGFNAIDDKRQEGDGCTPEGNFGIRSKYPHKSWNYFIWIDYPTKDSWSKYNKNKANGAISSSATIGGEIGIHGVPEGADGMIADRIGLSDVFL